MRSKLFVPGSRPELFAKALDSDADALSFDLEDAVADTHKAIARDHVVTCLRSDAARASDKLLIVRSNAPDSPHFVVDLAAMVDAGVVMLNLPKIESASAVRIAADALQRVESASGSARQVRLLVTIETPRALRNALEIATAHPRVVGLQLGLADLFVPNGIDRRDRANVHAAMFALAMAAAEAGVFAYDAAFPDLADASGFEAEAALSRGLGFLGKSCIHPKQVALANRMFSPTAAETAAARRVLDAAAAPQNRGRGAFVVDGAMVDAPFLKRAETVAAAAKKRGAR